MIEGQTAKRCRDSSRRWFADDEPERRTADVRSEQVERFGGRLSRRRLWSRTVRPRAGPPESLGTSWPWSMTTATTRGRWTSLTFLVRHPICAHPALELLLQPGPHLRALVDHRLATTVATLVVALSNLFAERLAPLSDLLRL